MNDMSPTYHAGRAIVIQGDARRLPLSDGSVDLVVTSPPFLNLRSYQDAGRHYAGQIGTGSRSRFLAELWAATAEMKRVLKPTGSIFVELGDSYTGKTLNLVPHRYAIGCVDELGLLLRAEIVWSRPNGLPESVTDRVRRSHSIWFHLVKQPRYYSAVDEIRESTPDLPRKPKRVRAGPLVGSHGSAGHDGRGMRMAEVYNNPLGKLPGSVWSVPSEPLTVPEHLGVDHYAAFPLTWPRQIILGWSPSGICAECGEGRRPQVHRERAVGMNVSGAIWSRAGRHSNITGRQHVERSEHTILGEACACPEPSAPTRPAVVLDPFGGTGTTALAARALGRHGITVDRSGDYCRLAEWRTTDPDQIAKAMRVDKPPRQVDDQLALDLAGEATA